MEVTLLDTGGDGGDSGSTGSSSQPLQLRVRVGGAEQFCQLQVGQSLLLPRAPLAAWPASPAGPSSAHSLFAVEEQQPAEVTLYELVGSQTLQPAPVGGLLEPDEVLKQSLSVLVRRPASASQLDLRFQRGGSAEEDGSGTGAGSQLTDEARQRDLNMRRLQSLVQDVLRDRPQDPRSYMLDQLRRLQALSSKHQQKEQRKQKNHHNWNMTPTPPANVGPTGQPMSKRNKPKRIPGAKIKAEPQLTKEVEDCQEVVVGIPSKTTSDPNIAAAMLADALADADDASANLLRALQPLPRGMQCGKLGDTAGTPVVPRPPDSPRKGARGGRSLMRGIASRIFGSANANAANNPATAASAAAAAAASSAGVEGGTEPGGGTAASGSAERPDAAVQGQGASSPSSRGERKLSQVQTEARFSLKHILRSAACSAAADQSMREKVQKDLAEKLSLGAVRNVRDRIVAEAADGMARRRGRPPSAARRHTGNGASSLMPGSGDAGSLPFTPGLFQGHHQSVGYA